MARKTLQEQTIKDNFLFAAAMMDGDNSKAFLSCLFGSKYSTMSTIKRKNRHLLAIPIYLNLDI